MLCQASVCSAFILVDFEWLPQNTDHDQGTHDNKIQLTEEAEK